MDKYFYIFAGVNGSGKSTLYKTNFLNKDINELMANSEKEEDIIFYNKLFNLILETKQDELIKKGVF